MDIQASKYSGTSARRSECDMQSRQLTGLTSVGSFDQEFEISSLVNFWQCK